MINLRYFFVIFIVFWIFTKRSTIRLEFVLEILGQAPYTFFKILAFLQ
jgi:hypothetical protein